MSSRSRWATAIVVVTVVVGAVASYAVVHHGSPPKPRATSRATSAPTRVAPMIGLTSTAVPTPQAVAALVARAASDPALAGSLAGEVVDASTGSVLAARGATAALPPASTAKLLTAIAALTTLGADARLSTGVVRKGDTLYLVGGGDVTLVATSAPATTYPQPASLADLAARTAVAMPDRRPVRLCVDTTAWTGPAAAPGWTRSYFADGDIAALSPLEVDEALLSHRSPARAADPAGQAARAFTAALRAIGVTVAGNPCRAAAPASGFGIASVDSPSIAALVQRMLTASDNDLAEALGRAVASHEGLPADFAGESAAVLAAVRALGVDVTGTTLVDASGLSRLDRVRATTLVALLRLAISRPALAPVLDGLPVAGATGTLGKRFRARAAVAGAGVVRAKTGTLAGVNSLAGLVVDADGRLLVFVFLADRVASPSAGEGALDRLAAALARCGCH